MTIGAAVKVTKVYFYIILIVDTLIIKFILLSIKLGVVTKKSILLFLFVLFCFVLFCFVFYIIDAH
jgi:hypothetical protein